MMRGVSIVILTWNGLSYTRACLESLRPTLPDAALVQGRIEVIVVDNGSTDGTAAYLEGIPWVRLVCNGTNEGFTRGNNRAIRLARSDHDIVLLNNDIVVTTADWLSRLQETAYSDPAIGVVGCRLRRPNGILQHAGTYIYPETCWGQQIGGGERDVGQYATVRDVEGVVFACCYIKRAVLDRIGLLDERYVSYFEDTDYCLRAREAGFRVVCDGRVTLVHHEHVATKANRVDFHALFSRSQAMFRALWTEKLRQRYERAVAWHSVAVAPHGYAVSSVKLMHALDDSGVDVRYRYVYGPGTPYPMAEPDNVGDYRVNVFKSRPFDSALPQVVYGQGDVFHKNNGRYKIGYTMLEVDGVPLEWVRQANRMHEVWVPSTFNRDTFARAGVRVPIRVMPLGVDSDHFNPTIRGRRFGPQFTFLSVFEWGERKGIELLFRAFLRAFHPREDVLLVCKITNRDGSIDVPHELQKLGAGSRPHQIRILYNQNFSHYLMGSLYRSVDCFVLPTRGEGWGMPILEAMACGLPVIATDWSAPRDFLTPEVGYPLRVRGLVPARAKCPYYHGFAWAEPDEEHLVYLLRHVYEHRAEAQQKGLRASHAAHSRWTWGQAAEAIKARLREIV